MCTFVSSMSVASGLRALGTGKKKVDEEKKDDKVAEPKKSLFSPRTASGPVTPATSTAAGAAPGSSPSGTMAGTPPAAARPAPPASQPSQLDPPSPRPLTSGESAAKLPATKATAAPQGVVKQPVPTASSAVGGASAATVRPSPPSGVAAATGGAGGGSGITLHGTARHGPSAAGAGPALNKHQEKVSCGTRAVSDFGECC